MVKTTGRAIHNYAMLEEGEPLLIGVSGGKDSLFLSLALSMRRKWISSVNPLSAALVEWDRFPLHESGKEKIVSFFESIRIPLTIIPAETPWASGCKTSCYLCARTRKQILFNFAEERGIRTIAFGHHMDDFIETALINVSTRGNFSTMNPVQEFFKGKIRVIRPLCLIKENAIAGVADEFQLPAAGIDCPNRETNLRAKFKPIVRQLVHLDKNAREHLFYASLDCRQEASRPELRNGEST